MPIDFTWDVTGSGGSGGSGGSSSGAGSLAAATDQLGSGLVRPFRRTERADFNSGFGVPEVLSCVGQVLGTRIGALPWRPDFGCDLERLRHRTKDPTLADVARIMVEDALKRWEPRAQLTSVEAIDSEPNVIALRVTVIIGSKRSTISVVF